MLEITIFPQMFSYIGQFYCIVELPCRSFNFKSITW